MGPTLFVPIKELHLVLDAFLEGLLIYGCINIINVYENSFHYFL